MFILPEEVVLDTGASRIKSVSETSFTLRSFGGLVGCELTIIGLKQFLLKQDWGCPDDVDAVVVTKSEWVISVVTKGVVVVVVFCDICPSLLWWANNGVGWMSWW